MSTEYLTVHGPKGSSPHTHETKPSVSVTKEVWSVNSNWEWWVCVSKVMIFISDKCLSVHNCDQSGAYLISEVIYIMSRRITLYDVVSHHEFGDEGWKSMKSQREI